MSVDIILITSGEREALIAQTLTSLGENTSKANAHSLTIVSDGYDMPRPDVQPKEAKIIIQGRLGASAARNVGAASIPKYRRGEYVCFFDDDVYVCKGWDERLIDMAERLPARMLMSGYGHPFNIEEHRDGIGFAKFPLLISSVAMFMSWEAWDEIGYWQEPGGPSASEDFDYCSRARGLGYDFAVTNPHTVMHTGMTASNGKKVVGHAELRKQNEVLCDLYRVAGRVIFQ
jgi:GT2 family glycosyltransferase